MSAQYNAYLETDYWKEVAKSVKARAGFKCQICNSPHDLQAHHRTYEHKGNELQHLDDLTCLCRRCHGVFHGTLTVPTVHEKPLPKSEEFTEITRENYKRLRCAKEMWHWMKDRGFGPDKSGWAKRMIGQVVPKHFIRSF